MGPETGFYRKTYVLYFPAQKHKCLHLKNCLYEIITPFVFIHKHMCLLSLYFLNFFPFLEFLQISSLCIIGRSKKVSGTKKFSGRFIAGVCACNRRRACIRIVARVLLSADVRYNLYLSKRVCVCVTQITSRFSSANFPLPQVFPFE